MSRSFGGRLFTYFLLFAIVPTVVVALTGYYLMRDAGRLRFSSDLRTMQDATTYHTNLLFDKLRAEAATIRSDSTVPLTVASLAIRFSGTEMRVSTGSDSLASDALEGLIKSARGHSRGFAELGNRYCQYVVLTDSHPDTLVLGLLHEPGFGRVIAALESERQQQIARRELWSTYLSFLGGIFLILSAVTVTTAFFMSRRTARAIARPLEDLSQAADRIAAGEFRQTVTSSTDREIRTLVESFNQMAAQLETMTARLAQTERVAAWRQIARRFAHELKNPLQPILISLYRIEQQTEGTEVHQRIAESLKAASDEVRHLQELAERFSQLAKLPAPRLEETDLTSLLRSVAEINKEPMNDRRFEVLLPDERITVVVDSAFVREAVHNLLKNAIEATDSGDLVELRLHPESDRVRVSVRDSGRGMDATTLASSRLPYFTTKEKGSGLGLAIVERSINEMGGQMVIESAPDVGTTVTLIFRK